MRRSEKYKSRNANETAFVPKAMTKAACDSKVEWQGRKIVAEGIPVAGNSG
jgi:hypothetical protein